MGSSKTGTRLTATERDFLTLVNRTVLANPFSDEREHLDAQIAGVPVGTCQSAALEASLRAIIARMEMFEAEGRADISICLRDRIACSLKMRFCTISFTHSGAKSTN